MVSTIVAFAEHSLHSTNRLISALRGRNFRILSITTGRTLAPDVAAATIVVDADQTPPQRVAVCLEKLEQVWNVRDVSADGVQRELALLKIVPTDHGRTTVESLVRTGAARLADQTGGTLILEVSGDSAALDRTIGALLGHGLEDVVRVGPIAMTRGSDAAAT